MTALDAVNLDAEPTDSGGSTMTRKPASDLATGDSRPSREAPSPYVPLPESPSPVVAAFSRREGDDDYRAVICHLDSKRRAIDCKDSVQWIVQRREGDRWKGVSFHRDRGALIERCGASGEALTILQALPEMHP